MDCLIRQSIDGLSVLPHIAAGSTLIDRFIAQLRD